MRQRAQAAGSLQNTPQEMVNYNQGNIELAPVNPQLVYVPAYNPWTAYGQPVSPYPGFSLLGALGSFFGSSPVRFGLGMLMTAFSHSAWGPLGWGLSWLTQSVLFHNAAYYSHSATVTNWGLPRGLHAFSARGTAASPTNNFYRTGASYSQSGRGYNAAPGQGFVRQPDRYAGNRPANGYGYSRGYQTPGVGYARPSQQSAYNRMQQPMNRPQQYSRPAYGSSFGSSFSSRPAESYGGPERTSREQAYNAPATAFRQSDFGERSSAGFAGKSFAASYGKPPQSSGFHPFGGGHAPKSFSSGKSFKGHSGGGGGHHLSLGHHH
jgi:hypothetical protein